MDLLKQASKKLKGDRGNAELHLQPDGNPKFSSYRLHLKGAKELVGDAFWRMFLQPTTTVMLDTSTVRLTRPLQWTMLEEDNDIYGKAGDLIVIDGNKNYGQEPYVWYECGRAAGNENISDKVPTAVSENYGAGWVQLDSEQKDFLGAFGPETVGQISTWGVAKEHFIIFTRTRNRRYILSDHIFFLFEKIDVFVVKQSMLT